MFPAALRDAIVVVRKDLLCCAIRQRVKFHHSSYPMFGMDEYVTV